ncbi:hypothetical protein AYO47_01390 [Planctomyces sp. SCGC AG-212-M04]|nr:hypothetical protein AYO47_01390 [Planctomyces sp. SCGC AG-212-M04]
MGDFHMYDGADPARGRTLLLVLITAVVASSAVVIAIYLALVPDSLSSPKGQMALATRSVRFLLTILLILFVYRGSVVAKWITIVLFGVTALIAIPAAFLSPLVIPLILIYGTLACCLCFSVDVLEFLEQQRSRRG